MAKHKRNDNNYAVTYYRFSSASQNELSIDMQRKECLAMAERRGLKVLREFDDMAKSAWKDGGRNRPGFRAMLRAVEELKPAYVIMYSSDRFARDFYHGIADDYEILQAGAMAIYTDNSIPETEGPTRQIALAVQFSTNEDTSNKSSKKITDAMALRGERGHYAGRTILGYVGKKDEPYRVDDSTAPLVQRMFADYAAGKSMAAICREVNAEGWRTERGKEFTVTGMAKILKNEAYRGVYSFAGTRIEGGMPRLVDDDLFDTVQKRLALNKRTGAQKAKLESGEDAPRFWLTGKLYCGHCGETMRGTSGTSKTRGTRHYYYECKGHRKRSGCAKRNERKDVVEDMVLRVLKRFLDDSELLMQFAASVAEYREKQSECADDYLNAMRGELKDVERKLDNMVDALAEGIRTKTTQKRLEALEERAEQLGRAIELEERQMALLRDEQSAAALFWEYAGANLDDPLIRDQVLEYFVDRIYLFDDRLVVTGWFHDVAGRFEWSDTDGKYQVDYGGEGFDPLTPSSTIKTAGHRLVSMACFVLKRNPNFACREEGRRRRVVCGRYRLVIVAGRGVVGCLTTLITTYTCCAAKVVSCMRALPLISRDASLSTYLEVLKVRSTHARILLCDMRLHGKLLTELRQALLSIA